MVPETRRKFPEKPKEVVEETKRVPEAPKMVPETPKKLPEEPKEVIEETKRVPEAPKIVPEAPKKVPEEPKWVPKAPKKVPEEPMKAQVAHKMVTKPPVEPEKSAEPPKLVTEEPVQCHQVPAPPQDLETPKQIPQAKKPQQVKQREIPQKTAALAKPKLEAGTAIKDEGLPSGKVSVQPMSKENPQQRVPLVTDLKQTTVLLEDSRESSLKRDCGKKISLAEEVGHRQEKARTRERGVELRESIAREKITLKREIRQQMFFEKEEGEVSTWCSGDEQVEDTESLEDIEPAYIEYKAETLEDTESHDDEDLAPEDKAVDQREEMSFRSVSPPLKKAALLPSKRDITPPPEITRPTRKEVSGLTSQKEVQAYKKIPQDRKLNEADITSTYPEQKKFTESFVSVHHEEIDEETVSPMEDIVKHKISDTSKEITAPKKPRVPKEVTLLKQPDSVEVKEVQSERAMFRRKTVSPPPKHNLTQIPPQTTLSHPMTTVTPNKESPKKEITKTPKAAGKMYLEDTVPLEEPSPVSEEVSFEEELVPATRSIPASREESPPVPARVPLCETVVCLEEEISPPKETVLPTKKTSPALLKAVAAPKEDFPPEELTLPKKPISKDKVTPTKKSLKVPPQKKPLPPEEEALTSKKPASLSQKVITPEVDSSEEARTTTTKPPPTREDDKKAKKGTQEIEQETLQKGILSYLSCTGS
ncbi:neurofilament heavy polypeptide-like [Enoplosus armatus]|uniref:neurofilament heavy polypeptide-like n=1 Tax=Enoplosus armatus TaxID=215367 RepID=UPI0039924BEE